LILDTSAVVAVLFQENGFRRLAEAMAGADFLAIGAPTLVELGLVMVGAFDLHGRALVSQFLEERSVEVVPFDNRHWSTAAEAFIRFGKGRHPASLNYGDCMTYATAKVADLPLLFVGDDFSQTDVAAA
jgi:ribonuclease VapC